MLQHFRIIGSGRYLPSHRISADELDRKLALREGTTFRRSGVRHRFQAIGAENAATMARVVIEEALVSANRTLSDIDLIIDSSLCLQQPIPCNAALIQEALGASASGIPCFDVHASCLGFIAALRVVNGLFASDGAKCVVVVCSETPLNGVNWEEPESACLMGDGAAAFVFEAVPPTERCVLMMESFAEGAHLCEVEGGGHKLPPFEYQPSLRARYQFHMDGRALHKLASRLLPPLVSRALVEAGCSLQDLDIVPHQASGPAMELIARRLNIPAARLHMTIAEHGNLVAASIPFVLHGVRQQRPIGSRVMLLGTAAGYTQAACILTL